MTKILRNYGYNIMSAAHSGDALLQCEKFGGTIDLLLVDVVMPRMNGPQLSERLKKQRPGMKVLFMSGYSDFTVVRQVMTTNFDNFIAKPFTATDLAVKVRALLDSG